MQPSALEYSKGLFECVHPSCMLPFCRRGRAVRALREWKFSVCSCAPRMSCGARGRKEKAMETEERGVDAEGEINGEQDLCALAASHNDGDGGVSLFPFVGFMFSRGSTASPLGSLCHCGGDTGARSPSARVRRIRKKNNHKKIRNALNKNERYAHDGCLFYTGEGRK